MKKSRYEKIGKIKLQEIVNNSCNFKQVIEKCGLSPHGSGGYNTLKKYIKKLNIDTSILENNRGNFSNKNSYKKRELFTENSEISRNTIRRTILRENLIEYKCNKCGNNGNWLGVEISLQLEHINGINNDNKLSNLEFLCPNCHSQTKTWGSKNRKKRKKKKKICPVCNEVYFTRNKTCSRECASKLNRKIDWDSLDLIEVLEKNNFNYSKTGRELGISDNAVRKRVKKIQTI